MICCREGCELPAIVTFHDKGKDFAKCGCVIHYFDMLVQFEEETRGHPHMNYVAYCPACNTVIEKSQATLPSGRAEPACKIHPTVGLRIMPINGEHLFKECVWEVS